MRHGFQGNAPPPPGPRCDYGGMPYCCCQDLEPEFNLNPRRPSAVNYQGDMALRRRVVKKFPALRKKAKKMGLVLNRELPDAGHLRVLGESLKVEKGEKSGVVTAILYLSPETEGYTRAALAKRPPGFRGLCPYATDKCAGACLGHSSGQLAMPASRNARAWKTILYHTDRKLFNELVASEIEDFKRKVRAIGKLPAIRLDGSTDTGMAAKMSLVHPDVQFYDYTKDYKRVLKYLAGGFPPNWHLTYSYAGPEHLDKALDILRRQGNVAVVFDADPYFCDPLPAFWHRFKVEDADADDLRFWDKPGTVAGLRFKQAAARMKALRAAEGFVFPVGGVSLTAGPIGSKLTAKRKARELRGQGMIVQGLDRDPSKPTGGWYVHYSKPQRSLRPPPEKFAGPFTKKLAEYKAERFRTLRGLESWVKKKPDGWYVYHTKPEVIQNPPLAHLKRLFEQKRIELDDAHYFNHEASKIARLRKELAALGDQVAKAAEGVEGAARHSMEATHRALDRDEWVWGHRSNPGLVHGVEGGPGAIGRVVCGEPFSLTTSIAHPTSRGDVTCPECNRIIEKAIQANAMGGPGWSFAAEAHRGYRSNPLLAIVGNPGAHQVDPRAFMARDRYRADLLEPGHQDAAEYWRGQAGAFFTMNPTKAENLLAKAIRPCMTREEAHHAASSIERSLSAVQRNKVVPDRTRGKITKLTSQARGSKTPRGRIRALSAANRMLQQLRTYGAGSRRPSKGYKRKRAERTDPRLGHILHGPALGEEAMERRRAFHAEELAANPEGSEYPESPYGHCLSCFREKPHPDCPDVCEDCRTRGSMPVRSNPLLAIVGNPGPARDLDRHRHAAIDLVHRALKDEDFNALRQAHEHMQAAYRCCSNPPNPEDVGILDEVLAEIDAAEEVLFAGIQVAAGKARKAVAGSGKPGRVKGRRKSKVRKNFKAKAGKSKKPRKKRYTLDEARKKFKGFDKAIAAYRRFHDREPGHVDVYELDDGESVVTVDDVHAALHRTLETNYLVPDGWDSNKNGSFWKHEHIEGAMEGKIDLQARIEDLPLEVFDVKRNRTIKLPNGRWYLTDWWRERKGRGENRRH